MATVDIENRDPGGTDATALVNRVNACTNTQQAVNNRMLDIEIGWSNPGPPDSPAALNALITECQTTITLATRLLNR
jgi:hypothetical protein